MPFVLLLIFLHLLLSLSWNNVKFLSAPLPGSPGDLWSTAGLVQFPLIYGPGLRIPQGLRIPLCPAAPAPNIDNSPAASLSLSVLCPMGCCSHCRLTPALQQEHTALEKLSMEIKQGWEGKSSCRTKPRHPPATLPGSTQLALCLLLKTTQCGFIWLLSKKSTNK